MTVATILNRKGRDVFTMGADATLAEAASGLATKKIGALVVCDTGGAVRGILSERDIVKALGREGAPALDKPVEAFMTAKVVTVPESTSIDDCMENMTDGRFRHLPVVESGQLAGIVSIGDIVKEKIAAAEGEAEALRTYITAG